MKHRVKVKRKVKAKPKARAAKKAKAKKYNPQTGRLTGRAVGAQERLETLAAKYMKQGLSPSDARTRAREEMRANPRKDWRAG